jgi:hypothetical protein
VFHGLRWLEEVNIRAVMNRTCIHLRANDPNIYMYRRGRIYKKPLEKYNNRKVNTYLIPPSNSWWINNTEFREVKLMMSVSLSHREEIYQLEL